MDKYKFPLNYNYSNKFMGIIEYKTLVPLSCYGAILIFIISLFKLDFFISTGIFTFLFFPFVLLLSVGFSKEPFLPFLISLIKFKKGSKIYLYKKGLQKDPKNDMICSGIGGFHIRQLMERGKH